MTDQRIHAPKSYLDDDWLTYVKIRPAEKWAKIHGDVDHP